MLAMEIGKILLIFCLTIEIGFSEFQKKTFSCGSGEYIASQQYCDGIAQCSDKSDEPAICSTTTRFCQSGKYFCSSSDSCVDVDLLSDVRVQKYCPRSANQSNSDYETSSDANLASFLGAFFSGVSFSNEGKFLCNNERCVNVHYMCDGYCDCFNCSDEISDLSEERSKFTLKNCSSQKERFQCEDNRRCLNLEYVCDGYCNCFDCSDEHGDCSELDIKVMGDCPQSYFPTPLGPRCISDVLSNSNGIKNIISNECSERHFCDQKCTLFKTRAICSCHDGYIKIPNGNNGFRCRSNESSQNALVYSTWRQIKLLNFTTGEAVVIEKSLDCEVLTAALDYLYYTTEDSNNIFKYSLASKKNTELKLNQYIIPSAIASIAVDYITDNLYFTTKKTLSVCTNDNRICIQLKCCNVNFVVLAPSYGWMFYTKVDSYLSERFIMKSNMDGSNEDILIDGSFGLGVLLAVDESIRRLYVLAPRRKQIISVSFFGGNSEIRKFQLTDEVVSIAALDSRVFFTTFGNNEIHILENSENFTKSVNENAKITRYRDNFNTNGLLSSDFNGQRLIEGNLTLTVQYLHAFNPIQQRKLKARNPCKGIGTQCTGLCLLRPINSANDLGYNCSCNVTDFTNTPTPYWCGDSASRSNLPRQNQSVYSTPTKKIEKSYTPSMNYTSSANNLIINEKAENHTDLKILCVIVLMILVLCGVYLVHDRCRRNHFTIRNFSQRQYDERLSLDIGQEEL